MSFVPLTDEEHPLWKPSCRDPQHEPPNMIVITHPMKWVCPRCGQVSMLYPTKIICSAYNSGKTA